MSCPVCARYDAMGFGQLCPCVHKDGKCMSFMKDPVEYETESRTKQSFREEADINRIVARARAGAAVTHLATRMPQYLDVSEVGDYKSALDKIREIDIFFERLPSAVRAAFDNDPAAFMDGLDTDEGRKILEDAGLIGPIPAAVPPRAPSAEGVEPHTHDAGDVTPPA